MRNIQPKYVDLTSLRAILFLRGYTSSPLMTTVFDKLLPASVSSSYLDKKIGSVSSSVGSIGDLLCDQNCDVEYLTDNVNNCGYKQGSTEEMHSKYVTSIWANSAAILKRRTSTKNSIEEKEGSISAYDSNQSFKLTSVMEET